MVKKLFIILLVILMGNCIFPQAPRGVMKISKLTGNIYKIDQNPTNNFVHLASAGEDGILLIDTAFRDTGQELLTKLKKLGNGEIKYVVNTHIHEDHIGANGLFAKQALIISHAKARERFFKPYYYLPPIDPGGAPTLTFKNSLTLHFNGDKVILKHVKPGHTDGDITVYFPGSKVLYIGDLVIHGRFSTVDFTKGGNIKGFMENLRSLIKDYPDDTRYILAHGPEYNKEKLRTYLKAFVITAPLIEQLLKEGRSVTEIINSDVFNNYKNWQRKRDWVLVIRRKLDGKEIPSICEPMTEILMEKGIAHAIEKYFYLKKHSRLKYKFDERQLNNLGYGLLDRKMYKESIAVFKLNTKAYPNSANAFDSLAEACFISGNKDRAMVYYKKSLQLDPDNTNAKEKLRQLVQKQK
jgi:glyoxylase-like metal-dependent hydrolase (beta-lactamase superfamily II)